MPCSSDWEAKGTGVPRLGPWWEQGRLPDTWDALRAAGWSPRMLSGWQDYMHGHGSQPQGEAVVVAALPHHRASQVVESPLHVVAALG